MIINFGMESKLQADIKKKDRHFQSLLGISNQREKYHVLASLYVVTKGTNMMSKESIV